jgi:phosphatidate phosphatase APP1
VRHHAAEGQMYLMDPNGISVISDIDDTIRISDVENRAELLANTFLREFRHVPGMPAVYAHLAARGMQFHYVTASPWQLHGPLRDFFGSAGYPAGSMHFRHFRLSDHFLKRLGLIYRGGKSAVLRRLLNACPQRTFILIGDSGERDPEIYTHCYREFPLAIRRVLIRLVRPRHRFRESILRARIGLPGDVFATFESAEELGNLLDEPFHT